MVLRMRNVNFQTMDHLIRTIPKKPEPIESRVDLYNSKSISWILVIQENLNKLFYKFLESWIR